MKLNPSNNMFAQLICLIDYVLTIIAIVYRFYYFTVMHSIDVLYSVCNWLPFDSTSGMSSIKSRNGNYTGHFQSIWLIFLKQAQLPTHLFEFRHQRQHLIPFFDPIFVVVGPMKAERHFTQIEYQFSHSTEINLWSLAANRAEHRVDELFMAF